MAVAMKMVHDTDPAKEIQSNVGDLSTFRIMGNRVLVAVYQRPEKTKGGILLTDQTRREDEHQGKAGLVLKKGVSAFVDDHEYTFSGDNVKVGDWIALWVTDGRKIVINGQLCRVVRDQDIVTTIPTPDAVF